MHRSLPGRSAARRYGAEWREPYPTAPPRLPPAGDAHGAKGNPGSGNVPVPLSLPASTLHLKMAASWRRPTADGSHAAAKPTRGPCRPECTSRREGAGAFRQRALRTLLARPYRHRRARTRTHLEWDRPTLWS